MNYKIRVKNEAESKEAQELFFELGYGWRGVNPRNSIFIPKKLKEYFIINYEKTKDMQLSGVFDNSETLKTHKEITISELRDLPEFNFEAVDDFVESNVEQGVKHSHYKKDISHLDTLDIYRVTELFNPHSCGAHIAKKALCSGQRGHKDLLTDIQDIIDTAERWKEMLIEDETSSKD